MADKWEDKGRAGMNHEFLNAILPESMETHTHCVQNTDTGEFRLVRVDGDQEVGDAIAKGQFED